MPGPRANITNEDPQLWGTMSVGDHMRPTAFVAEIGLFNTLVVPVPPPEGGGKWDLRDGWDGALQAELLNLIPEERLRRVSWDERRGEWERRASASMAEADVASIQEERAAYVRSGGTIPEYETREHHLTRQVLQDFLNAERERNLIRGMPQVPVTVIPAYDGPASFIQEQGQPKTAEPDDAVPLQERLLRAFQWEFLMPGHDEPLTKEKHKDLIKKAVELADVPEVKAYRKAFIAWTSIEAQRNIDLKSARAKMESLMSEYAHAVSKLKWPVAVRWGMGIVEVLAAGAAIWMPWFGLVSPILKLGENAGKRNLERAEKLPERVRPAALVHGQREAFEKVLRVELTTEHLPLSIEQFWPRDRALLYL
jgi:hypothetical protein